MANYVGQDISGLDLTGQNLTGVDFTNANATNVIFTNAIITNAIFKNTLITGATLTGITFSDLQKGHLLLRAANHTNSAVNNLTTLTPAEFRIIQPSISVDMINTIQTLTVKIPNTLSDGNYTIVVTPNVNQLVCIFVATNQNIVIATSGGNVRTIRSNGTVVQDIDNVNATLNYLKIGLIPYRMSVGNGDGVIAMIPIDLNVYQVCSSGLGDIISLNLGPIGPTGATGPVGAVGAAGAAGSTGPTGAVGAAGAAGAAGSTGPTGAVGAAGAAGAAGSTGPTGAAGPTGAVGAAGAAGTAGATGSTGPIGQPSRDENQALVEIGALPRKPDYWATNWSIVDSTARNQNDIYVSVDGKIIASASPVNASTGSIRYSTDYGATFGDGNVSLNWQTICGTSQGSQLFAISSTFGTPSSTTLYQSTTQGATWTQITSPGFASDAYIHRMRCSGDGTYLTATDLTSSNNGRYYTSSNSGTTWTARTLSASAGYTHSLCFSRSGAIQYVTWSTSGNTNTAIYRSFDYGVTFTLVQGHIADGGYWRRIECDATGRFIYAARYVSVSTPIIPTYRSDDYGATWTLAGINGIEDIWVSATGQFVAGVSNPQGGLVYVVYSNDYGRFFSGLNMGLASTTTYRSFNGSSDGSVLVLGSIAFTDGGFPGTGFIRVARQGQQNIQDLTVTGGGGTLSKSSGVYTLNVGTNIQSLYYNSAATTSKVIFTLPSAVDLRTNNIRITMNIRCDRSINYPCLSYNDQHVYPTSNSYPGQINHFLKRSNGTGFFTFQNNTPTIETYSDGSVNFCGLAFQPSEIQFNNNYFFTLDFIITMNKSVFANTVNGHWVTNGKFSLIDKTFDSQSNVLFQSGEFTKINELTESFLRKVSFFSYDNTSTAILAASMTVQTIPTTFVAA